MTLTTIGEIHVALNDAAKAEQAFRQALEIQEELRDLHALGFTNRRLAGVLGDEGREAEALTYARRSVTLFQDLGDEREAHESRELVQQLTARVTKPFMP